MYSAMRRLWTVSLFTMKKRHFLMGISSLQLAGFDVTILVHLRRLSEFYRINVLNLISPARLSALIQVVVAWLTTL